MDGQCRVRHKTLLDGMESAKSGPWWWGLSVLLYYLAVMTYTWCSTGHRIARIMKDILLSHLYIMSYVEIMDTMVLWVSWLILRIVDIIELLESYIIPYCVWMSSIVSLPATRMITIIRWPPVPPSPLLPCLQQNVLNFVKWCHFKDDSTRGRRFLCTKRLMLMFISYQPHIWIWIWVWIWILREWYCERSVNSMEMTHRWRVKLQ